MSLKWKQGDWEIHLNARADDGGGTGYCLRHMGCNPESVYGKDDGGSCSCSKGECFDCKLAVPDEVKGFFELVKWKR